MLYVPDRSTRSKLTSELSAEFAHDYLCGYFEATVWPGDRAYIIDYNRLLPELISLGGSAVGADPGIGPILLKGVCAQPGSARGRVRLISPENIEGSVFDDGDILVCDNTDVRFVPLMKRAGAIVTNRGGVLSHAAIVARELGKPCVIGTRTATQILSEGQEVLVDATAGIVVFVN